MVEETGEKETKIMLTTYMRQYDEYCQMNTLVSYSICGRSKISSIYPKLNNETAPPNSGDLSSPIADITDSKNNIMGHALISSMMTKKYSYMICRTVSNCDESLVLKKQNNLEIKRCGQFQSETVENNNNNIDKEADDAADAADADDKEADHHTNENVIDFKKESKLILPRVPKSPPLTAATAYTAEESNECDSVIMCIRPGRNLKRKYVKVLESNLNGTPKKVRLVCSPNDLATITKIDIESKKLTSNGSGVSVCNKGNENKKTIADIPPKNNNKNTVMLAETNAKTMNRTVKMTNKLPCKRGRKPLDVHHKCESFPVMVGSKLDRLVNDIEFMHKNNNIITLEDLKNLSEYKYEPPVIDGLDIFDWDTFQSEEKYNRTYNNPKLLLFLSGCFIIRGQTCILPFTLINNREWLHNFRNKTHDTIRLFLYDKEKRGHKFEFNLDAQPLLVTRKKSERPLITKLNLLKKNKNIMINVLFEKMRDITHCENDDDIIKAFDNISRIIETGNIADFDNGKILIVQQLINQIDKFVQIETSQFIYRDYHGVNHMELTNFKENIKDLLPYNTDHIDINKENMIRVMTDSRNTITDIDNIKNKLILSPMNTLFRFYDTFDSSTGIMWINNLKMLIKGTFHTLISRKISFEVKKSEHNRRLSKTERINNNNANDTQLVSSVFGGGADSNIWRKPLMNQVAFIPKMLMTIHKPKGKNVKNPNARNIPDDFGFFICPYVLGNLGNMGSNPSLVYDIESSLFNTSKSLMLVIRELLSNNLITVSPFGPKNSLIVNGLPWALCLTENAIEMDWQEFVVFCKNVEKFCHITRTDNFIYFYFTHGIPMKPIYLNTFNRTILCSPIELHSYFSETMKNIELPRLSLMALSHANKFAYYASFPKVVVSTNSSKLMLPTSCTAPLHKIISGSTSAHLIPSNSTDSNKSEFLNETYVKSKTIHVNNNNSTIELRTLFADYLMYNVEDTYIINSKLKIPKIIQHYANIEFVIENNNIQIIPFAKENRLIYIYDNLQNRKHIVLYVCKIISKKPIVLHPYAKLSRHSAYNKRDDIYIYTVYKYLSHTSMLLLPTLEDIKINVSYNRIFEYNQKLNIIVHIVYKIPRLPALKLCNSWGQKGICVVMDLSNIRDEDGEEPDIITSVHSFLGREAVGQCKEMALKRKKDFTVYNDEGLPLEKGGFNGIVKYFCVGNFSSDIKNFETAKRMDRMTLTQLDNNNAHYASYTKQQDALPTNERNKILPSRNRSIMCLYAVQKTIAVFENDTHKYHNIKRIQNLTILINELEKLTNSQQYKCLHK